MGKFLRDVLLFGLLGAAIYVAFLFAAALRGAGDGPWNIKYRPGEFGGLWERVRDSTMHPPHDLLMIGSSLAYRGGDPRVFAKHGYRLYNLGSSAQTPLQTEVLLKRHWQHARADVVLFIVTEDVFCQKGYESSLDLIANDRIDQLSLCMVARTPNIALLNTTVYAVLRHAAGTVRPSDHNWPEGKHDVYVPGGYVERKGTTFNPRQWTPLQDSTPLVMQKEAFERCLEFVRKQGAQPVIISPPVTDGYWLAPGKSWGLAYWQSLAPYYDYSRLHQGPDSLYFQDGRHQNQHGVVRFDRALVQDLVKDGWLAPKD
ncbi:MAG: hypothetical protein KBH07_11205 [Flavobacteriales bacterium]|nr:hypothetical protein [Flavobacteriales bacterium]MBP9080101.1 hypothetical protein [Flavobacteriales bacterium]